MKRYLFLPIALLFLVACSNSDTTTNNTQIVASGSWRVTLFTDSGNDETSDFAGYTFTFSNGGVVTAVKNAVSQTGSWSTTSSKFIIDLGPKVDANRPLGELTDDWKILSVSTTEIRLADDNVSSSEFLTFTKN